MEQSEHAAASHAIRAYLAQLDAELAGCDAALRHDALVDAESHLRAAMRAGATSDRAIDEYGTPAEVARAYLGEEGVVHHGRTAFASGLRAEAAASTAGCNEAADAPARPSPVHRPRRLWGIPIIGIWADPSAWGALLYFGAVGFALATAYFVWAVSVGGLAFGLLPTLLGLPVFVALLGSARAICLFEGRVVQALLGVRMPRRTQPVEGTDGVGFWTRIWCWLRDVRSWLSLAYLLGNFPVSVVAFAVTVALTASGAVLVVGPVLSLLGLPFATVDPGEDVTIQLLWHRLVPDADGNVWIPAAAAPLSIVAGLAILTATLWLARGLGWVYGHTVQAIQVARPQPVPPRGQH